MVFLSLILPWDGFFKFDTYVGWFWDSFALSLDYLQLLVPTLLGTE